ncbi:MAG: class I SAM-dependent methyltransferase [Clostridium sp.]
MLIDQSNNTEAFNKISDEYEKYRPSYPDVCFDFIDSYFKNEEKKVILDVGCGTGIATRKLYKKFNAAAKIIGLEPSDQMRKQAINHSSKNIEFIKGVAEELPFKDEEVSIVTTAQAIQWFVRPSFYKEVNRVLEKGGLFVILQNNRDWKNNDFLDNYEDLLEKYNKNYNRGYRNIDFDNEIRESKLFSSSVFVSSKWGRFMLFDDFLGLSRSSTKAKKIIDEIGLDEYKTILGNLFKKYMDKDNKINITYITEMYMFKK